MAANPPSIGSSTSELSSSLDDMTDRDYDPSDEIEPTPSTIFTTPSKRVLTLKAIDEIVKEEVDKITCGNPVLSMKRCVIENIEEVNAVQYCHVLARATKDRIVSSLEYSWGLKNGHLNVDSRSNILRINSRLHHAFDRGNWALIPSNSIIKKYRDHKNRGLKNNNFMQLVQPKDKKFIQNGPFEYVFVPLGDAMRAMPIHRQVDSEVRPGVPQATDFEHHAYPFNTLPKIQSHIHPRFVICNTAQKFLVKGATVDKKHRRQLKSILDIYTVWTEPVPLSASFDSDEDENPHQGHEERRSEASYRTRSARWDADSDDDNLQKEDRPSKRARSEVDDDIDSLRQVTATLVDIDDAFETLTFEEKKSRIINWVEDVAENNGAAQAALDIDAIRDFRALSSFTILFYALSGIWNELLGPLYGEKERQPKKAANQAQNFFQI